MDSIAEFYRAQLTLTIDPDADNRTLLMTYGELVLRAGTSVEFIQVDRLLCGEKGRIPELAMIARDRTISPGAVSR